MRRNSHEQYRCSPRRREPLKSLAHRTLLTLSQAQPKDLSRQSQACRACRSCLEHGGSPAEQCQQMVCFIQGAGLPSWLIDVLKFEPKAAANRACAY